MNVLLINTYDRGGAANACKRLHLALLNQEVDSKVLLKFQQNNWPKSSIFSQPISNPTIFQKLKNKLNWILKKLKIYSPRSQKDVNTEFVSIRPEGLEFFTFPNSENDITQSPLYKEADIINLHWVANFLDFESFFKKNKKPIIWTLHDMNPFSGGEHYLEKYLGIDEYGKPLRRVISKEEQSVANKNVALKKQAMSAVDNLTIVAPSKWLAEEARKSEVFKGKPILCIPYGLDPEIFTSRDQDYSKDLLNIPRGKKVILFVADSINKNRKGFIYLLEAFKQLELEDVTLCTIGSNDGLEINKQVLKLGDINDEKLMSYAYSAADVFVIPSIMDNLPNTVLESLMCGTPVIGFPVGGIPDMIQDGVNGLLTNEISVTSLFETLTRFLNITENFDRNKIRKDAIEKYNQYIQAKKYIDLFQKKVIGIT